MPLTLERQRQFKQAHLTHALSAAGVPIPRVDWLVGRRSVGYRNRIRLRIESGRLRFFNSNKTPDCAVLEPQLLRAIERAARWAASRRALLEAYDYAEVRRFDMDGRAGLYLGSLRSSAREPSLAQLGELSNFVIGTAAAPLRAQRWPVSERGYTLIPVGAFMQVNDEVNRLLIRQVLAVAAETRASRFCDLYCGSGNFSIPLLERGLCGSGAELNAMSIAALQQAARAQRLDAAGFVAADVSEWARSACESGRSYDLMIVNPPRAGAAGAVEAMARLATSDVLLCYCRADSLVRDAAQLVRLGFRPERLWCADMFPHTRHFEMLLWLRASGRSP